ncbi:TraR/DksA C4-type zinc finger protein [soil metagenome]
MSPGSACVTTRTDAAERLTAELARTCALETSLTAELQAMMQASVGSNADDEHDPEGATIAFERAQAQALLEQTRARLAGLRHAVERLDDGTYGTCAACGGQIAPERLLARPAASTCIRCAR